MQMQRLNAEMHEGISKMYKKNKILKYIITLLQLHIWDKTAITVPNDPQT